jgi:Transposase zinc-ribbon domain
MESPRTLQDAIVYFKDYENCKAFMMELRWPDGKVKCPHCSYGRSVSVEPFHLFRYLDEQAYRYNNRKEMDDFRFFAPTQTKNINSAYPCGSPRRESQTPRSTVRRYFPWSGLMLVR